MKVYGNYDNIFADLNQKCNGSLQKPGTKRNSNIRLPIPLCNLRLFAAQLCQDRCPSILTFGEHIIPPAIASGAYKYFN